MVSLLCYSDETADGRDMLVLCWGAHPDGQSQMEKDHKTDLP